MTNWWREIWSEGQGQSRVYCGIAKTADGYAVDVFRGDVCIFSEPCETRFEAAQAADDARREYGRAAGPAAVQEAASVEVPDLLEWKPRQAARS